MGQRSIKGLGSSSTCWHIAEMLALSHSHSTLSRSHSILSHLRYTQQVVPIWPFPTHAYLSSLASVSKPGRDPFPSNLTQCQPMPSQRTQPQPEPIPTHRVSLSHPTPPYPITPHSIPSHPTESHHTPQNPITPHRIPSQPTVSHHNPTYPITNLTSPNPGPISPAPIPPPSPGVR